MTAQIHATQAQDRTTRPTASALQIAGIVLLVTGTLPISLPLVLFTVALCFQIVIDDITRSE